MTTVLPAPGRIGGRWASLLSRIAADVQPRDGAVTIGGDEVVVPEARAVSTLSRELYARYYLRHAIGGVARITPDVADRRPVFAREDPAYGRRIRAVVGGRFRWEAGWRAIGRAAAGSDVEFTLVQRGDVVLYATDDELRATPDGVAVRFPAEHPHASPGFFAISGTSGPHPADGPVVRVYLHLRPDPAPPVFGALASDLDGAGLRYSAKLLNDPAAFPRPDSAVLYVARADLPAAASAVLARRVATPDAFGDSEPAFTARLAPGIGLADEPVGSRQVSFGQHRCAVLARALLAAGPAADAGERLLSIVDHLAADGLDPQRLHLNPGAAEYDLGRSEWAR